MRAKFVRGQDPRDAMGIGDQVERDIQKIDKFVSKFGFEKIPRHPNVPEETHLKWLAEWVNPKLEVYLTWYYYTEKDIYFFYTEEWKRDSEGEMVKGLEYEGSLEDLFYPGVFQNILDGEPMYWKIIKESINFERGMDPKKAMDIGFDKALELEQDHADFKVWTYGDLVFFLDQDRNPPWDWNLSVLIDEGQDDEEEIRIARISQAHMEETRMEMARSFIKEYLSKNESINFKRGRNPKTAIGIGGAALIPLIPRLIFEEDAKSPYYVGGGRAIDNIRRIRNEIEVKFFTNPLYNENDDDYDQDHDKMEYLKSILIEIGVIHMFEDFSWHPPARIRFRIKEQFLIDFIEEIEEDTWYDPEKYGLE